MEDEGGDAMEESLPRIPGITCDFPRPDGFSRPEWEKIYEWLDANEGAGAWGELFSVIEAAWTNELGASISADYNSYVSDNVILVSPQLQREAIQTLAFCERVHAWLASTLGQINPEIHGRHVVVLFDNRDEYWEYVSWFCPDGESGASAGMAIMEGSTHVAVAPSYDGAVEQMVMAHELLHSFVIDRALPVWLEEGVAQRCESHFFPDQFSEPEKEDFQRIKRLFDETTIQRFWTGEAFDTPRDHEEQKAVYALALILCNVILHDFHNPRPFFENATWDDAGESAARDHLGKSLAELAGNILGPGDWRPRPDEWPMWEEQANGALTGDAGADSVPQESRKEGRDGND